MHTAFIAAIPLRRVVCPLAVVAGVFVVLCTRALPAFAQRPHVVYGTVVDAASAVPIPYVEVWLVRDQHVVTSEVSITDASGRFDVHADGNGTYALYSRRIGYSPVVTSVGELHQLDSLSVSIKLAAVATALPTTITTGRNALRDLLLSGFDHRRALGLGAFITYDEIQRKGTPALSELLREIPGVSVRGTGARVNVQMGRASEMSRCEPLIYMDGQRATHSADPPNIIGELLAGTPGTALEAVEVYRGRSELPAEFADPDARCGVIVVWTRRPALHELPAKRKPAARE